MDSKGQTFFGSTTLGEKGQVVIPIEARDQMKLTKGQKLLAFGMGDDMLILAKPNVIEQFSSRLTKRAKELEDALKESKSE